MQQPDFQFPLDKMSKGQIKIADCIAKSVDQIPFFTEEDIAVKAGVSIATVSRFWKAVGYDNLKSFKKHLQESNYSTPALKMEQVLNKTEQEIVPRMLASAAVNLEETGKRLSLQSFEHAVEAIHSATTIYAHGPGAASCLTELLRFRLNRLGLNVRTMAQSGHELLESLAHAGSGDVVLLFGFVRKSPEAAVILEQAAASKYTTILVTDLLMSDMIADSDIVLQIDRGDRDVFHSLAAPVALVESLSVALAKRSGKTGMNKLRALHALRKQYATLLPK